jgi:hypothetical protein
MAEWLKALASKACIPLRVSGVRIPLSPPDFKPRLTRGSSREVQFHQVSLLLWAKAWRSVSPALILNKLVDVFFTKLPQAFSLCRLQAHEITSGRIDCAGEDPPDPRVARFGVAPLPPGFSQRVGQRLRSYVSMPQCRARPARANSTEIDRSLSEYFITRACHFLPAGTSHS